MPLDTTEFTTGPATLPDVGNLAYNGCNFSPLFVTSVSGGVVKDNANRTTKFMEYTITADGYATMPDGDEDINGVTTDLRTLLTAQGGTLVYTGRGIDMTINPAGGAGTFDVAWGPIPELLEFQPLGGGRSAKVRWQVKVRIPEVRQNGPAIILGGIAVLPLLQFNYDTGVSYAEDGYSTLSIKGTMEVAMTRTPNQQTRRMVATVDDGRSIIEDRLMSGIDLARFRIVRRDFPVSRDKRTLEWDWAAEEKPYMDLPPDATIARGTYTVRPKHAGMALATWLCTLRCTYIIRRDRPRRFAWFAFLALLRERMRQSSRSYIPELDGEQNPKKKGIIPRIIQATIDGVGLTLWKNLYKSQDEKLDTRRAFLIDFAVDEGVYLDSKSVTFSATWRLNTSFSHILLASGIWRKLPTKNLQGENHWAISMRDVSGSRSWLRNSLDQNLDVIVDFGGG